MGKEGGGRRRVGMGGKGGRGEKERGKEKEREEEGEGGREGKEEEREEESRRRRGMSGRKWRGGDRGVWKEEIRTGGLDQTEDDTSTESREP